MRSCEKVREFAKENLEYMKLIRRQIHKHPELSGEEYITSELIRQELDKMGISYKIMHKTGIVALIEGTEEGKTVLLRADMDALPIQEAVESDYKSEVPGVMHACGHDGHVASLLGAAKILSSMRDEIHGTVKLVFQPSEEYYFGGREMVKAGALEDPSVDYAIGLHLWGAFPKGYVAVKSGEMMAAPDIISFGLRGKGGHGSAPEDCCDLVLLTCEIISAIYARLQRKISTFDHAVLSLCSIHGGEKYNVLPNEVDVLGTLRIFDVEVRKQILKVIEDVLKAFTQMEGVEYVFDADIDNGPVLNDNKVTEIVKQSAVDIIGEDRLIEMERPDMGGEDFAYFSEKVPSCFYFVGISEDMDHPVIHHSDKFCWDDDLLEVSSATMAMSALNVLDKLR